MKKDNFIVIQTYLHNSNLYRYLYWPSLLLTPSSSWRMDSLYSQLASYLTKWRFKRRLSNLNLPSSRMGLWNLQAPFRLNGQNYLVWSQPVRTYLKGKGKISHLTGLAPNGRDPKFAACDEEDAMIMSWLWNSKRP